MFGSFYIYISQLVSAEVELTSRRVPQIASPNQHPWPPFFILGQEAYAVIINSMTTSLEWKSSAGRNAQWGFGTYDCELNPFPWRVYKISCSLQIGNRTGNDCLRFLLNVHQNADRSSVVFLTRPHHSKEHIHRTTWSLGG